MVFDSSLKAKANTGFKTSAKADPFLKSLYKRFFVLVALPCLLGFLMVTLSACSDSAPKKEKITSNITLEKYNGLDPILFKNKD
jgi:hypothetical protein